MRNNKIVSTEIPNLFILGCERSGSTWVSNIIDSHPDVEFFMEPFADYANVFPGFPERNFYMGHSNTYFSTLIKERYFHLSNLKYLLRKRGEKGYLELLEKTIVIFYNLASKITRLRRPLKIEQFTLLNLNRKSSSLFFKNKEINLVAIKELRLNFKIGFLSNLFPKVKILIIVRDPAAQITSIIKLMNKGHLGEMEKYLNILPEFFLQLKRFEKYKVLIDKMDWGEDIEEMLIVWWLINYDILIEDCKRFNIDYKIVYHEDISENPDLISRDIFRFIGLNYSEEVTKYVKESSNSSNHQVSSAIDTYRDSSQYYKKQLSMIEPRLLTKISKGINSINISEELRKYQK